MRIETKRIGKTNTYTSRQNPDVHLVALSICRKIPTIGKTETDRD